MAQRQPNHRLAEVMRLASCSNSGLANRVVSVARENGVALKCDHVNVKRWLLGVQPSGLTPQFIAVALARKLGRPVTLAEIGLESRDGAIVLAATRYPEQLSESIGLMVALVRADLAGSSVAGTDHLDPSSWADLMVRWLVAPDLCPPTDRLNSDDAAVAALSQATTLFSEIDYRFGGGYARSSLVQYASSEVVPLLTPPSQPLTPALLRAAGALLRLTGWTAYDTGRHGLAQRYLTQALRLAQASGDAALGGRVLAGMSHQANFLGYADSAVNLARAAQVSARGRATPTAMALFHAMEARALATRGDRRDCERALADADRWFERRVPEDDPPWLRYFDHAELAAEFAHSYRDLGMANKAVEYAHVAIDEADPLYARSISFCRAVLAAGFVARGEVEQGLLLAEQVASDVAGLRSVRCAAYLADLLGRLEPFRKHQAVAEFVERTAAVIPAGAVRG